MLYLGLLIGAAIVVPMSKSRHFVHLPVSSDVFVCTHHIHRTGYIYSVTGYQIQVGYFNELFYGYAINLGGSRHPVGSLSYRVISGQCMRFIHVASPSVRLT